MQPRALKLITLLCAALLAGAHLEARGQESGVAASFARPAKEAVQINVLIGQSKVVTFDRAISRLSVSNPEVAEAVLVSPEQVVVNGKTVGQVNFVAWAKDTDRYLVFDVAVRMNLSTVDAQMRVLFPDEDIRLSQANGSVIISGRVADARRAAKAEAVVAAAGFKTVNLLELPVQNAAQVQLQVRVAEVSRSRMRELGTSYAYQGSEGVGGYLNSGAGPSTLGDVKGGVMEGTIANTLNLFVMGGNTLSFLRALKQQGALRSLAEPNLIAMDGQQASFLAGGEFPIPVVQSSGATDRTAVTIVFKEYGVRLNFKPTIIDEDHIRLEMEPEVSTIDFANGIKFEGFTIPALKTRRARTGVELRDGQSFALAGLLDNNEVKSLSKVPGLGDIPIIGALFRSKSFQKNETELMFIVTAQLVKPVGRDDLPAMRGIDGLKQGSPLGVEPKGEGIEGASGYSTGAAQAGPYVPPSATTEPPPPFVTNRPAEANAPAGAEPKKGSGTGTDSKGLPAISAKAKAAP